MKIEIRYFASIREALGAGERLEIEGPTTVAAVRDGLIARDPRHALALSRGRAVRIALDQVICDESAAIERDAELAFFPPVTGG